MQREMTPKATATLLKTVFAEKGAPITHTEALDLVARMKGYNAWSHYQAVSANRPADSEPLTLEKVLVDYYGADGDVSIYPRKEMAARGHKDLSNEAYWRSVAGMLRQLDVPRLFDVAPFEPAPSFPVTLPSGKAGLWNIELNLTDRWGEWNDAYARTKPGLAVLAADAALYNRCLDLTWDEIAFVVRKDGKFGVLYEVEYASRESEEYLLKDAPEQNTYAPHEEVVAHLLGRLAELAKEYPTVEFCVPPKEEMVEERPAVWAFISVDKPLDEASRARLGQKLLNLD